MEIVNNLLLALHFLGLVAGMGSGMASGTLGPRLATSTGEELARNWASYKTLSRTAHIGLGILIVTGVILVFTRYGDPAAMNIWFWIKMALVVVLIASITIGTRAARKAQGGDMSAMAMGKRAGMVNGVSGVLIILAAVFSFNPF